MAGISHSSGNSNFQIDPNKNYTTPLVIVTALFFMWGFITCLNDILIPHLKEVFHLSYAQAMLIQSTFFGAYFIMSLPAGTIVSKLGYKNGIIIGLITAGIGCFMFYPAAETRIYAYFLGALFILASGITLLQVAANPYVSILGKPETSSSRLNLTQAFNSLGTTLAPLFGAWLIFTGGEFKAGELSELSPGQLMEMNLNKADAVKDPYIGLAITLFVLALIIKFSKLPSIDKSSETKKIKEGSYSGALKYSHLVFGVLCIFMYVGGEVSIGSFIISFLKQPHIADLTEKEAARYVSIFWGGAMIGRFIGAVVLTKINPAKALGFCGIVVVLLLLAVINMQGHIAMWAIVSIGLFNSIMFPTIFTLAIKGLGPHTSYGSALLVMAIVGGAVVPFAQGQLADFIGIQMAFFLPVICYAYIVFYGFIGSKVKAEAIADTESEKEPIPSKVH